MFVCVLALVAIALFLWLRSSSVLAVEDVTAPVTHYVTERQIADAVSGARGVSLLKVSTGAIEKSLSVLPYVRSIHVHRKFPHTLEIRIEEYDPVARLLTVDGKVWLVSDNGRLLGAAAAQSSVSVPLVVTATQFQAQAGGDIPQVVLAALPVAELLQTTAVAAALPALDRLTVSAGGEVVVYLQGGAELRLGEPMDLKQKITVATQMVQMYLRDGKTLDYVDASAADRVAVKAK